MCAAGTVIARIESYRHPGQSRSFFKELEVRLPGGAAVSLIGISGAGKTTLINIMLGIAVGRCVADIDFCLKGFSRTPAEICQSGEVGFLPQRASLLPWRTVRDNILLLSQLNSNVRAPRDEEVIDTLERLGLPPSVLDLFPNELSGGMHQRVAFARELLHSPSFLFLDEAFLGLDTASADLLRDVHLDFLARTGASSLLVTHDIRRAIEGSSHLLYLSLDGSVVELDAGLPESRVVEILRQDSDRLASCATTKDRR